MTPKMPKPTPPPPPVTTNNADVAKSKEETKKRMANRYNFQDTVIAPQGGGLKRTMA
jgi:hypothetical protein